MSNKIFYLPDLGEGLPDAEIVEWMVKVGDTIRLDEPLVSMETAKAVVELPSPFSGKVLRVAGGPGDVITTGAWLVEMELDASLPQRAEAQDTGHAHGAQHAPPPMDAPAATVDAPTAPTGADGVVTLADVKRAAEAGSARVGAARPAPAQAPAARSAPPVARPAAPAPMPAARAERATAAMDTDEPIRGVRRNMVRTMSAAHAEVVPTTLMDDADLHAWSHGEDIMARLIRALAQASAVEPALNAWFNAKEGTLRRHSRVDVGIAVDSPEGLFVPALRNADRLDPQQVRAELNRLRDGVKNRSLPPEDLTGFTLMLSNFGVFAGKYATPIVVPPCVCIVGAGRLHHAVVPVLGGMETHRMMPLSLTFDHRAATGGEAARFLRALIDDLQRAH